ncbi:MAG: MMPL family transporter [Thermoprotei archaeon]|jgi:RND superfamily putative drug exporter
MVFEWIVKNVISKWKILIIFWIIILLISIPLSMKLDSVLSYNIVSFLPSSSESVIANNIIQKEFGNRSSSQFIIVINGSDIRSQDIKIFLIQLNFTLSKNASIDSLYSAYTRILETYFNIINKTIDNLKLKLKNSIITLHNTAYNLKNNIILLANYMSILKDQTNKTTKLIYLAPSLYTFTWSQILSQEIITNASQSVYMINSKTNNIVRPMLIKSLNATDPTTELILSYYNAFVYSWNKSFPPIKIIDKLVTNPPPLIRAQTIINNLVSTTFFPNIIQNKTQLEFIQTIAKNFNITNWNNSIIIKQFVINYTYITSNKTLSRDILLDLYPSNHATDEQITNVLVKLLQQQLSSNMTKYINTIIELGPKPTDTQINELTNSLLDQLKSNITSAYPKPVYPDSIPVNLYNRYVSNDNKTMLVYITYTIYNNTDDVKLTKDLRSRVHNLAKEFALNGFSIYVSGEVALSADLHSAAQNDVRYIDMVTVILVIVLLIVSFLSPITPLISLFIVGSMLMISQLAVYLLAQYVTSIYFIVRPMLTVVIMGAGTDYTIYIIYRFYEERLKNNSKDNAIKTALRFGGEAVATSATTVIIGFSSLMLSSIGILRSIGLSLAIAILIALIISLTFTPSILVLLGDKVFWPSKLINRNNKNSIRSKYLKRLATTAVKKPGKILLIFLLITIILMIPLFYLSRDYREIDMLPNTESKIGFTVMEQSFGTGFTSPNILVIKTPEPVFHNNTLNKQIYGKLENIAETLNTVSGVASIKGFTRPDKTYIKPSNMTENTLNLIKQYVGNDNQTILYTFTINAAPSSSEAFNIINNVRTTLKQLEKNEYSNYAFYITGETAQTMDITGNVDKDFFNYMIPFALIGIYIVLLLALRSIFTPLRLILTILMSISWTLGIIVLLLQIHFSLPIYWALPIFLFMSIIGLGIDYDIFLVTRTKEEVTKGIPDEEAIVTSVETTGTAITICGMIMASAFATLLISSVLMLKEIGFTLSLAVTLDAFIVRILLVPSIMMLMKKWNWWLPKLTSSHPKIWEHKNNTYNKKIILCWRRRR